MERTVVPMPIGSSSFTDWDLHLFGLWLGARTLPSAPIAGLKCLVLPVEYIRCAETRYILQHLDTRPGQRILDIGSPKLLSLFLAARLRAEVHGTDLVDYSFKRNALYSRVWRSAAIGASTTWGARTPGISRIPRPTSNASSPSPRSSTSR